MAVGLIPVVIRLLLVPWSPSPEPRVPDEFSHLLVADTLLAGRLANPPHPLWRHFETAYVLEQPTHASIYSVGQGAVLALGRLVTGHSWGGVLLSVALMSGALAWMLYGCLPATWAALGGLLASLHLGLQPLWIDSYWGGAFGAFGGALAFGALARLWKSPSMALGATAGGGWAIVWLTRPYESVPVFGIIWLAVAAFIASAGPSRRRQWLSAVTLLAALQLLAGTMTLLHNHAVTRSWTTLPYELNQTVYGTPPSLLWQAAVEPPPIAVPELQALYEWQRKQSEDLVQHPYRQFVYVLREFWRFYVTRWYSLPLLFALLALQEPRVALAAGAVLGALVASTLYPFFYPHYVAAYACLVVFLITRGLMRLSSVSIRGLAVGRLAVAVLAVGGTLASMPAGAAAALGGASSALEPPGLRRPVTSRLRPLEGRHVVFVRYGPAHSFHDEWVYNAADVDDASIVWCREMGPAPDAEVMRYYRDRQGWLASVNDGDVRLSPYHP